MESRANQVSGDEDGRRWKTIRTLSVHASVIGAEQNVGHFAQHGSRLDVGHSANMAVQPKTAVDELFCPTLQNVGRFAQDGLTEQIRLSSVPCHAFVCGFRGGRQSRKYDLHACH